MSAALLSPSLSSPRSYVALPEQILNNRHQLAARELQYSQRLAKASLVGLAFGLFLIVTFMASVLEKILTPPYQIVGGFGAGLAAISFVIFVGSRLLMSRMRRLRDELQPLADLTDGEMGEVEALAVSSTDAKHWKESVAKKNRRLRAFDLAKMRRLAEQEHSHNQRMALHSKRPKLQLVK